MPPTTTVCRRSTSRWCGPRSHLRARFEDSLIRPRAFACAGHAHVGNNRPGVRYVRTTAARRTWAARISPRPETALSAEATKGDR
jgi:hypothetical protein